MTLKKAVETAESNVLLDWTEIVTAAMNGSVSQNVIPTYPFTVIYRVVLRETFMAVDSNVNTVVTRVLDTTRTRADSGDMR